MAHSEKQQKDFFSQIHINIARNATDDFNLFHDPNKWDQILKNPFEGPIALGFQLESLIEHKISLYRQSNNEHKIIADNDLHFSNYQFSFANVVKPNASVEVQIKRSLFSDHANKTLSNRVSMKADDKLALIGYKKESQTALFLPQSNLPEIKDVRHRPDRSYLPDKEFFLKRKFMNISNAKNFLCGSLVDQSIYFDELLDKIIFPEIFPCGLISCALLEKGMKEGLDFKKNPMVYSSHKISVNRTYLSYLKSNDVLHILIKKKLTQGDKNRKCYNNVTCDYECYGLIEDNKILYRALISLVSLSFILQARQKNKR